MSSETTTPPRVLHVVLSLSPGGTERLVIELAKALYPETTVGVCCLDDAGSWAHELTSLGIPVVELNRKPGFRLGLARQIAKQADSLGASVLHCHHYSPFIYGRLAAFLKPRLGVVYTEHGRLSDGPPSNKRKFANFLFGRTSGRFFAVSHDLREHLINEGFPPSRMEVIHNGISPELMATEQTRHDARATLNLSDNTLVIGTVARLDPVKDLGTLIHAFKEVCQVIKDTLLIIVGDGPEMRALQQVACKLRIESQVQFTGHRNDVRALLPAFDIYANSSVTEGISVTLLEAMAAGIPVIATRVGGTPELVTEQTGILAPARLPEEYASALIAIARDPERRRLIGTTGRNRVCESFSLDAMVSNYTQVYSSLS